MKCRAKVKCFVGNTIRDADEVFEYEGPENKCLEPIGVPEKASKGGKPVKTEKAVKAGMETAPAGDSSFLEGK